MKPRATRALSRFFLYTGMIAVLAGSPTILWAQTAFEAERLNDRAVELALGGNFREALPLAEQYVSAMLKVHGERSRQFANALYNLSSVLRSLGHFDKAEQPARLALSVEESLLGDGDPRIARMVTNVGLILQGQNRLLEAEPYFRRALVLGETSLRSNDPTIALRLNNLATILYQTNRRRESEDLVRRAVAIFDDGPKRDSFEAANALASLAKLVLEDGRLEEAVLLLRRGLAVSEKSLGPNHPAVTQPMNALAEALRQAGSYAEAETLLLRALAISEEMLGPEHPNTAVISNNLALLLERLQRFSEALIHSRRVVAIYDVLERQTGTRVPTYTASIVNLASILRRTNAREEAEEMLTKALLLSDNRNNGDQSDRLFILSNLALVRAERNNWAGAAETYRLAKPLMTDLDRFRAEGSAEFSRANLRRNQLDLRAAARAKYRADKSEAAMAEGFELAQWAMQMSAADAIAQMAARFNKGTGLLSTLVRDKQDREARQANEHKRLIAALASGDVAASGRLRDSAQRLREEVKSLDAKLSNEFPDYVSLAVPRPLDLGRTRELLAEGEILLLPLAVPLFAGSDLPDETLVWLLTRSEARWYTVPIGYTGLAKLVTRLRCGLDADGWTDTPLTGGTEKVGNPARESRGAECARLLGADLSGGELPPFDLAAAHELFKHLLGPVKSALAGRKLIVVASGALTRVPFDVLVTEQPKGRLARTARDFEDVAWLARQTATAVLPSVASLASLRRLGATRPQAPEPYFGVGNPLLTGDPRQPDDVGRAAAARRWSTCAKLPGSPASAASPRGQRRPVLGTLHRGGLADAAAIRSQTPLPETAGELCAVAATLKAPAGTVLLAEKATEAAIKKASTSGLLGRARILHFATHGFLAGESAAYLRAGSEPGLVLTPPVSPDENDDGFLGASEIAGLKIGADWVVLSACNTAAGDGEDDEPLSGLARAFFYAGASAMLVSHWAVDSDASVKLTTNTFAILRDMPGIGRAEALRRSRIAMMRDATRPDGWPPAAHPSIWAPFVLVGDGS